MIMFKPASQRRMQKQNYHSHLFSNVIQSLFPKEGENHLWKDKIRMNALEISSKIKHHDVTCIDGAVFTLCVLSFGFGSETIFVLAVYSSTFDLK